MNEVLCFGCGVTWETNARIRSKFPECPSCRMTRAKTIRYNGDKCIPWHGKFLNDVTPIDKNGEEVFPGFRLCGHSDCVNIEHIKER